MDFIKNNINIFSLIIIAFICLFFSLGHIDNVIIDVGREMYYPYEILNGKILYRDLFCIYGPFSYLFNAILYKIFGVKLTSLYIAGVISTILITGLTYKIAEKFLDKFSSFVITLFFISAGCLSTSVFNLTLPYSYAVIYGLVCFLSSIYLLILYNEKPKNWKLLLSGFFAGLAFINKYDFLLYFLPFLYFLYKTKNKKLIFKTLFFMFVPILAPFFYLFLKGLTFNDLIQTFNLIKTFTNTQSLKTFYSHQGVYYTEKLWGVWSFLIIKHLFSLSFIYLGFKFFKKNILSVFLIIFGCIFTLFNVNENYFLFLTFLTFILFIIFFKRISYIENIFIISSLLVGIKSLWGLSYANYGLYYIPFIFISFYVLISKFLDSNMSKAINLSLVVCSSALFISFCFYISYLNYPIKTDKGILKTSKQNADSINETIDFINNIKENNPYVMVLPEGLSLNFLSGKKTQTFGYYNSLIPIYIEGDDEKNIIEYYKNLLPKYIIFWDFDFEDYGKGSICKGYANKFCAFVYKEYKFVKNISKNKNNFFIFKLK